MEAAGPALKHVSLELGGSDPTIVLDDADLDAAVKNIQIGRYWNCGQACLAPKRAFVQAGVYDAFVEQLAGRVGRYEPGPGSTKAEKPRLRIGPLHTAAQRELLTAQLKEAVDRGAKVVVGGEAWTDQDTFQRPCGRRPADSRLATERSSSGPSVWKVDDLDRPSSGPTPPVRAGIVDLDPLGVAIDRPPGLRRGDLVNSSTMLCELPFGGTKQSGSARARAGGARRVHGAEVGRRRWPCLTDGLADGVAAIR